MPVHRLNQVLLILHFIGLTMGFASSFANMAMAGLIAKAAPPDKGVLGRFPPIMSRIGRIGLALLWASGLTLTYTKYGGFAALPPTFHLKLTAVVLMTAVIAYLYSLERRIRRGETAAAAQIPTGGKIAGSLALLSLILAVLTFD